MSAPNTAQPSLPAAAQKDLTASQLLTAEQLADRWQVTPGQVYRLAREGSLPVVRIGRYKRFRVDAILAWEQNCEASNA